MRSKKYRPHMARFKEDSKRYMPIELDKKQYRQLIKYLEKIICYESKSSGSDNKRQEDFADVSG